MNYELEERIRRCETLPSLPAAAIRVLELSQQEDVSLDQLADAIQLDPALCSTVLRTINSSFYGLSQKVGNIRQAVVLLGIYTVKTLVLSFSLGNVVNSHEPKGFNRLAYWRRCIYSAAAARVLAGRVMPRHVEDCFVAALLMDLGTLILDQVLGQDYVAIYGRAATHSDLPAIESEALGVTHADAGAILARHWKLPPLLEIPMAAHHRPDSIQHDVLRKVTEIISLAGRCADVFNTERPAECIAIVRSALRERYQITEPETDALLVEVGQKTAQLAPLFDVRLNSTSYESILERASQRLLELSLGGQSQQPQQPANRRRAARMRREGRMFITPCDRGVMGEKSEVRLRDISTCGLGFTSAVQYKRGFQFVVQLPGGGGGTKTLLYSVVRSIASQDGSFEIGAELAAVLTPQGTPVQAATPQAEPAAAAT